MDKSERSQGYDQSELFDLCRLASTTAHWKDTLEEIYLKARDRMIFDNLVIYMTDFETHRLDVLFARATGRGKAAEADASWGEFTSVRALQQSKILVENPEKTNDENRLQSPFLMAIPIYPTAELPGVLVFIRFGGPEFTDIDIEIGSFLADLSTFVIRKKNIEEFTARLENEKIISRLQSDFISTISHELRSPLGFIKGYTTTLLRKDTEWDRSLQNDFLEIIERETNNLTDLIDNLLDSSRLQSGHMKFDFHMVRVDSLIRDEINRALLADPDRNIQFNCEPNVPPIYGDARRLAQVFDNLLSNAKKYAPSAPLSIKVFSNHDYLNVVFEDSGPGIPQEYLPNLFTRFFRVPDQSIKVHGSGLGLFICKQIIDNHQGVISVVSSDTGTAFTIQLPLDFAPLDKSKNGVLA